MEYHSVKIVLVFLLVRCSSSPAKRADSQDDTLIAQIDSFVETVMECLNIPGMSLAVVRDDQTLLTKGYGLSDVITREALTNQTMMVVASVTKEFVATVAATAFERNRNVNWDTPIRDIIGDWFYFNESYRTLKVTTRDLLSHRVGLSDNNPIRLYAYPIEEFVRRLRFLNLSGEYRYSPKYNNLMYALASFVIETLEGTKWETLAKERLFEPLGMTSTTFVPLARDRWHEFATGYYNNQDFRPVSLEVPSAYYQTSTAPGGLSSNAIDMAKWLHFQLDNGKAANGTQLVDQILFNDTHSSMSSLSWSPYIVKPSFPVTYTSEKYALGWMQGYYRGFEFDQHSGSITGFQSLLSMLRSKRIGVFNSVNLDQSGNIRDLVHMYVMDLLLGEQPWFTQEEVCAGRFSTADFSQKTTPVHRHDRKSKIPEKEVANENQNCGPSQQSVEGENLGLDCHATINQLPTRYIGQYGHLAYGNMTVYINETTQRLTMEYGQVRWELELTDDETVVNAQGIEPFWYWTMALKFEMVDGIAVSVITQFDYEIPPKFVRDLDTYNLPPPPQLCI